MTTPTSHIPNLLKLTKTVTTSTPTHPILGGWTMFPEQGADSPLSEIENAESPAQSTTEVKYGIFCFRIGDFCNKPCRFMVEEVYNWTYVSLIFERSSPQSPVTVFSDELVAAVSV